MLGAFTDGRELSEEEQQMVQEMKPQIEAHA